MHYKTIVLELLQQNGPLHEQLRRSGTLLTTLNDYAQALRNCHQAWMRQLQLARPEQESTPSTSATSSEALELAIAELQAALPSASDESDELLSLDAAMAFVRRHTPSG